MMFSYVESTLSFPRIGRSEDSRMHEGNLSDAVDHLTISTSGTRVLSRHGSLSQRTMSIVGKEVQSKYSSVFVAYALSSFVMVVECNVLCKLCQDKVPQREVLRHNL